MFQIEEKILERSINDGKMKSIASMRVECEKNQEKILERMMSEKWSEDLNV